MIGRAIGRAAHWSVDQIGVHNLVVLSLLTLVILMAGYGFSNAIHGVDYKFINVILIGGILTGWFTAARFNHHISPLFMLLFTGLAILFFASPGALHVIYELSIALFSRLIEGQPWGENWGPVITPLFTLGTLFINFLTRPVVWIANGIRSGFVSDSFVVQFVWGWAFWGISAWCGYWYRKHRSALFSITPIIGLLALTINYVREDAAILIPIIGCILLLMAIGERAELESFWERTTKDYSDELRYDTVAYVLFISAALAICAWIVPSISIQKIARLVSSVFSPQTEAARPFAESLGLEPGPGDIPGTNNIRYGGLPRRHLIGSGQELEERVIMVISTGDLPPMPEGQLPPEAVPRYYWRSTKFSEYIGTGWQTGTIIETENAPGEDIAHTAYKNSRQITQHVTGLENLNEVLYAAGTPISADARTRILWQVEAEDRDRVELFAIRIKANDYRVTSIIPNIGSLALEDASTQYPEWITKIYLQLPDDLPQRVRNLAISLTHDEGTVYTKAKAIETYLRTFDYTLDLPEPPTDRDIVDYFLFSLRRGYCDYYASSMVVLARAVGIPARLAIGYASGTYDPSGARYLVSAADAHSWPEIYFPEYGWVAFEPTGGEAPLNRPLTISEPELPSELVVDDSLPDDSAISPGAPQWIAPIAWIAGVTGLLSLMIGLAAAIDRRRLRATSVRATIKEVYRRVQKAATQIMERSAPSQTPLEFAEGFLNTIEKLDLPARLESMLAPINEELDSLVKTYNRAAYSAHRMDESDKSLIIHIWERMRTRLLVARLSKLFRRRDK